MRKTASKLVAAAMAMMPVCAPMGAAAGEGHDWYLKVGMAAVMYDEKLKSLDVGGAPFAGGDVELDTNWAAAITLGYHLMPAISLSMSAGSPLTVPIKGTGTIAFLNDVATALEGPAIFTANYHLTGLGPIVPYVGGGFVWLIPFGERDGSLDDFEVSHGFGGAVKAGVDYNINDRWGINAEIIKLWVDVDIKATIPAGVVAAVPVPTRGVIQVDPVIVNANLVYRFDW